MNEFVITRQLAHTFASLKDYFAAVENADYLKIRLDRGLLQTFVWLSILSGGVTTALVHGALIPLFGVHAEYLANNPHFFAVFQFFNFIFELAWIFVIDKEPSDPDQVSKEGILDILKYGFFLGVGIGETKWFGPAIEREKLPNNQVWLGNLSSFGLTINQILYNFIKALLPFPLLKNNLPEEVRFSIEFSNFATMTTIEGARTMMFLLDPAI